MKRTRKKALYVETSVVSYLTTRPSANLLAAANQKMTVDWWEGRRQRFDLAVSSVHGLDFLLTWNCRHIDNAEMKPIIREICARSGHRCPEICTPQELMGVKDG
jgi:hypothetical protein